MARTTADPASLFKTAPFVAGPGASAGGPEIVDGGTSGVAAFGDSEGDVGGAGGDVPVAGEAAGETAGESDDGGTTTGDGAGDNALLGGVATGVLVGDNAGDEAGDWAIVELINKEASSITAKEGVIVEGVIEGWRRKGIEYNEYTRFTGREEVLCWLRCARRISERNRVFIENK